MDWLVTHGGHRELLAGDTAVREGDPLPSIMLVLEGALLATCASRSLEDEPRVCGDVIGLSKKICM
jgi:hypothetical protein